MSPAFATNARVTVSYGGTGGHCGGLGLPQYRLTTAGSSFERLVSDENWFERSYPSMQMVRCAPCLTLADVDYCVAAHMAVDNRRLLPPYPPVGACEDTLFGIIRSAMHASDLVAFVPYAVLHDPAQLRPPSATPELSTRVNDIVIELTGRFLHGCHARGANLLTALGHNFRGLASLGTQEFVARVGSAEHTRITKRLRQLDQLVATRLDAPGFWRVRIRSYQAQWRALLLDPDTVGPSDLGGTPAEQRDELRRVLGRYGDLLAAWPRLVDAAAGLRDAGRRVSKPI
jgi:hypothetical protein